MTVFNRICLETKTFVDVDDPRLEITLERGKEYLTSRLLPGDVVRVFAGYWFDAPVSLFGGERLLYR